MVLAASAVEEGRKKPYREGEGVVSKIVANKSLWILEKTAGEETASFVRDALSVFETRQSNLLMEKCEGM